MSERAGEASSSKHFRKSILNKPKCRIRMLPMSSSYLVVPVIPGCTCSTEEQLDFIHEVVSRTSLSITDVFLIVCRLAGFTGDLSAMTAPPFILSPTSLTEFPGAIRGLSCIDRSDWVFQLIGVSVPSCLLRLPMARRSKLDHWLS
jgi:hypothetical protein